MPKPQPLHLAVPDPLRTTTGQDQRTLKPEEPPNRLPLDSAETEDRSTETLCADGRLLSEILEYFDQAVQEIKHNLESITDLDVLVPTPESPWIPENITHWEARWCLQHVIAELARHAGHADIIRETIDGKGSYELNALADAAS
ncbi:DUF664 domain-containing protein [Corynebacterium hindlerae]|nr:DUF664 domain-containing protein [Corynebacterium hindlerae]